MHRLVEQMQFCEGFITLLSQNVSFQTLQSCQFLNQDFIPTLTYGHESWAMIERILLNVQVAELEFLWRVHSVALHNKVCSCEIHESFECWATSLNWEIPTMLVQPCVQNVPGKISKTCPVSCTLGNVAQRLFKDQVKWLVHLWPCLALSWDESNRNM